MEKILILFLLFISIGYSQAAKSVLTQKQITVIDSMIAEITDSLAEDIANTVTLNTAQTITGQKTFSNNKTVFGSTTSDSVRITGELQVNRIGIGNKYSAINDGLMLTKTSMRQNNRGGQLLNYINNYDEDLGTGEVLYWGLTGETGSGLFSYNLPPYSFGINTGGGKAIVLGSYSYMSLGLFPLTTYMQISSLKFGGLLNDIYTPQEKVTMTADTIDFDAVVLLNGNPLTTGGSVENADSLGGQPASDYVTKAGIDGWSTNLYSSSATQMRLGKSYADRRFNNGNYPDFWIIDYVVPPYNLSSDWLYPIEHRTDYYNDTLNTVAHSDILNVDGTGTPIWKTDDVNITGNEIQVNIGDLPDSTVLDWELAQLTGNKVILSEANKTAGASRFPMPIKGYEFKFGSTPYYTYPEIYSYYSDLTTQSPNLETAYHFYGQGNYPSYFGGNILTDGYMSVQDSIIIGSSTVKIYPDSITIGGTRVAKITEAGNLDTSTVNALIEANEDSSGSEIIGTIATLDSIITDYWNDELGGSTIDTSIVNNLIEANEDSSGQEIIGTYETLDSIITDYWNDELGGTVDTNTIATKYYVDTEIEQILDAGDVRVPFMWAYLQLDTTGSVTNIPDSLDAPLSTNVTSAVFGISANDVVRVAVDSARYKVKYDNAGSPTWTGWLTGEAYYKDVDSAQVQHYSSGTGSIKTQQFFYVSNDVDTFSVTTVGGSPASPSYDNPCGVGDRTDSITVTKSGGLGTSGDITDIVNGNESETEFYLTGGAISGQYIRFDFGSGISKVIDEAIWIQSETNAQGTWKWQGSDNASDWTDIGSSFTLAGASLSTTLTELNGNTTGYRYYQLLGVSGNTSSSPYVQEIRFKIDDE